MSSNKVDDNSVQKSNLVWIAIYLGISAFLSFVLPFPVAMGVLLIIIISLNILRADKRLRKEGIGGIKGWYKSLSFSGSSKSSNTSFLKFHCMKCGFEHKEIACPKCGSKAVKAE
jgi:hypothetical protein